MFFIDGAAVAAAQDRAHMSAVEFRHAFAEWVGRMSEDDLGLLHKVLVFTDDDKGYSGFMQGLVVAEREHRFGYCGACGTNHEADIQKLMGQPGTTVTGSFEDGIGDAVQGTATIDGQTVDLDSESRFSIEVNTGLKADAASLVDAKLGSTDRCNELMEEYNIDVAPQGSPTDYVCKGCGLGVVSITDRMLKPPGVDGCSGCQQKQRWG